MRKFIPLFLLLSNAAVAGFFPINKGMVNQATYGANAGSTTTLVASSNQVHVRTGIIFQIFKLPDATTLPNDWWYDVVNNSSSYVTVQDSNGGAIASVNAGRIGKFILQSNATVAGTWQSSSAASDTDLSNYFAKTDFISSTSGAGDAGKPVKTGASGIIDPTFIPGLGSTIGPAEGGTGASTIPVAGNVLIGTNAGIFSVGNVSASNNGLVVTASSGALVLSNQQDLRITGSPTFAGATLSGVSTGFVTSSGGVLGSGALPLGGSSVTGVLGAANGGLGVATLPGAGQIPVGNGATYAPQTVSGSNNGVTVTASPGGIAISNSQNLKNTASPTFAGITLSGLSDGIVSSSTGVISGTSKVAYNLLNLTGNVTNSDVAGGAGITRAKLATGTAYGIVTNSSAGVMGDLVPCGSGNVLQSNGTAWFCGSAPAGTYVSASSVTVSRDTTDPTVLGHWRSFIKVNVSNTVTDSISETQVSPANGFRLFAVSGTGAGTAGQPQSYMINIGAKRSAVLLRVFSAALRTGVFIDPTYYEFDAGTEEWGLYWNYNEVTGNVTVRLPIQASAYNRFVARGYLSSVAAVSSFSDLYFDIYYQ